MPSPFPGMNPYLEQEGIWQGFHAKFLAAIGEGIVAQVRPDYVVELEEHLFVHEVPPDELRRLIGRADVSVAGGPGGLAAGLAVAEAPATVELAIQEVERLPYLEIRDRRGREVVAVVELLSPSNKRAGPDRARYLAKRAELLYSPAHLVEIDLLRGGEPMPMERRPACLYSLLISRADDRPRAGFWPIGLRDRLPEIGIPLRTPHPGARIDLQAMLDRVYDSWGYDDFLYDGRPEPPLGPEDAAWAAAIVPRPLAEPNPNAPAPPDLS
ncbi:DUF4058 family protein [Tautonia rosea]|uniref:DUF4058 family protein n=1 Tax=Tautonia rosea TaxID=2728037 RepID=UPI0014735C2A|nr:DUF4058 family protein [Tautonia rosea]